MPTKVNSLTSKAAMAPPPSESELTSHAMSSTPNNQRRKQQAKFLVGRQAKNELKTVLSEMTEPKKVLPEFQKTHSLHTFLAKAFGTTPIHEFGSSADRRTTRGDVSDRQTKAREGIVLEPFQPESVLTFLEHLGVTRYEVHKKLSDTLKVALEDEIEGVDIAPSSPMGEKNRNSLLELLKSAWQFIHVPDLRPIVIALVKKLGDRTPAEVLTSLAKKDTKKDSKGGNLKHGELLQQFGLNMRQLVWEADWASVVRGDGIPVDASTSLPDAGTFQSGNILSDMLKPAVEEYLKDQTLKRGADLMFPATAREKKVVTQSRRAVIRDNPAADNTKKQGIGAFSSSTFNAIASSTSGSTNANAGKGALDAKQSPTAQGIHKPSSGSALAKIKEIMGARPKLLAAILNMLIAEHGATAATQEQSADDSSLQHANLICTLVADILLSYGQLPRAYEHVSILASVLDNSVKIGMISNQAIAQIQGCLRAIFQPVIQDREKTTPTIKKEASSAALPLEVKSSSKQQKASAPSSKRNNSSKSNTISKADEAAELQYELKRIRKILEGAVVVMKDTDPRGLFLNPVTDQIAPKYSMVIKIPICIRDIEKKAINMEYSKLEEYKADVDLMFKNCIMYNIGLEGKWFRDEALRQQNIWKDQVWSRATVEHKREMTKRKEKLMNAGLALVSAKTSAKKTSTEEENTGKKRKHEIMLAQKETRAKLAREKDVLAKEKIARRPNPVVNNGGDAINRLGAEDVNPLSESRAKKRKKDTVFPSMPVIAAMLLSDPFVVRLLLDKVLRAIRDNTFKDKSLPACHQIIPSVLQLLHLSQFSMKLCAIKGRRFVISSAGLNIKGEEDGDQHLNAPFLILQKVAPSLRKVTPLFSRVLLEMKLDYRMSSDKGDLFDAKDVLPARPPVSATEWKGISFFSIHLPLVEGSFVHILQPGESNEVALMIQIPRLVAIINQCGGGNMRNERHFFFSLSQALLKHKLKLSHGIRDLIVKNWLSWFNCPDGTSCVISAVHECLMHMLTEWASMGNKIMPRDKFLSLAEEVVKAADTSCHDQSVTFAHYWMKNEDAFSVIKSYYESMLKSVPEEKAMKWKESTGIDDKNLERIATKITKVKIEETN